MNFTQLNQFPLELQQMISLRDYAPGQILFTQKEPASAIYILKSGQIRLLNYTEDGQQINHYSVRAGDSFAELALFKDCYLCTAIATAPSQVLVLPKHPLLLALKQHPDLAEAMMMQLAQRLHDSKMLLELRSIRSAPKRVLHYLHLNVQADQVTVQFERPLKEIADDLGLTPEALSRALKQLHKQGKINRRKRNVTIRNELTKVDSNQGRSKAEILNCGTTQFHG